VCDTDSAAESTTVDAVQCVTLTVLQRAPQRRGFVNRSSTAMTLRSLFIVLVSFCSSYTLPKWQPCKILSLVDVCRYSMLCFVLCCGKPVEMRAAFTRVNSINCPERFYSLEEKQAQFLIHSISVLLCSVLLTLPSLKSTNSCTIAKRSVLTPQVSVYSTNTDG